MRASAGPLARLAPAIGLGVLAQAAEFPAAILTTLVLTRHVGAGAFADLGIALAILSPVGWTIGATYQRLALARAIAAPDPRAEAWAVARRAARSGAVAWIVLALAAGPIARATGRDALAPLLVVGAAEFVLLPVALALRSGLTATGRFAAPGTATALFFAARLALALGVVAAGGGVVWALAAFVAARAVEAAWCARRLAAAAPAQASRPRAEAGPGPRSARLAATAIGLQVVMRVDILLLPVLGVGATRIGEYAAAQQIANTPGMAASVVAPMLSVVLAGAAAARADLERRVDLLAATGVFACIASAGPAWAYGAALFGEGFAGAGPLLALLMAGGGGLWLFSLASGRWVAHGRAERPLVVAAPMAAAALAAHPPAIAQFGAEGAAAVTCAVALLGGFVLHAMLPGGRRRRCAVLAAAMAAGLGAALAVADA